MESACPQFSSRSFSCLVSHGCCSRSLALAQLPRSSRLASRFHVSSSCRSRRASSLSCDACRLPRCSPASAPSWAAHPAAASSSSRRSVVIPPGVASLLNHVVYNTTTFLAPSPEDVDSYYSRRRRLCPFFTCTWIFHTTKKRAPGLTSPSCGTCSERKLDDDQRLCNWAWYLTLLLLILMRDDSAIVRACPNDYPGHLSGCVFKFHLDLEGRLLRFLGRSSSPPSSSSNSRALLCPSKKLFEVTVVVGGHEIDDHHPWYLNYLYRQVVCGCCWPIPASPLVTGDQAISVNVLHLLDAKGPIRHLGGPQETFGVCRLGHLGLGLLVSVSGLTILISMEF